MNRLFFGDNLEVLRNSIAGESADLIYLDPPFNSRADYNVIFGNSKTAGLPQAQITAFEDTWHWNGESSRALKELFDRCGKLAEILDLLVRLLGPNDLSAYLVMMAIRLVELHRVLKPTGSLYLHCDPTASHYLKLILDFIFGHQNYRSEITWKRSSAHSDTKQGRLAYGNISDIIFYYTKSNQYTFNTQHTPYTQEYIESFYKHAEPDGRRYQLGDLTAPGGAAKGNPYYEVMGVERYWRYSQDKMSELIAEGRVVQTKPGTVPRYKRYLDEMSGVPLQNIWDDIKPVQSQSGERLGYPTQKPAALLERIIEVSSHPGDLVLDPFCGCGTALHAAQKLGRKWIGIDSTHLAISLIESRFKSAFPGISFEVCGTPRDLEGARDLARRDKYQFQWWACSLVEVPPYQGQKKGADSGIDGLRYISDLEGGKEIQRKIIVSVKGGENIGPAVVRDLMGTVQNNRADMGWLVTLADPTKPMIAEAAKAGFFRAGNGRDYPRLQILTVEDLITKRKRPEFFDMSLGGLAFKRSEKERTLGEQQSLF